MSRNKTENQDTAIWRMPKHTHALTPEIRLEAQKHCSLIWKVLTQCQKKKNQKKRNHIISYSTVKQHTGGAITLLSSKSVLSYLRQEVKLSCLVFLVLLFLSTFSTILMYADTSVV